MYLQWCTDSKEKSGHTFSTRAVVQYSTVFRLFSTKKQKHETITARHTADRPPVVYTELVSLPLYMRCHLYPFGLA